MNIPYTCNFYFWVTNKVTQYIHNVGVPWRLWTLDAAVLDALEIGCYDLGCFDTHSVLDAAVLDGTILDVVNTPYEGDFGCFFGGYEHWMLRFWMLRKLDATLLDASILTRCWVRICLIHSYASFIIFCGWMNAFSTGSTVVPTMQRPPDHPLTSLTWHCSGSQANAIARGGGRFSPPPPWLTPEPRSVAKQARRRSKGSTRRIER